MDSASINATMKNAIALKTGEVFEIIYNGGSQPGKKRMIFPLKVSDTSVYARCFNSNSLKSFLFDKIELCGIFTSEEAESWKPIESRNAFQILEDFGKEEIQTWRKHCWENGYLIGFEEKFKIDPESKNKVSTGEVEIKVYGHKNDKNTRKIYLVLINDITSKDKNIWKLKVQNKAFKLYSEFDELVVDFDNALFSLPNIYTQRNAVEYFTPQDTIDNLFKSLWTPENEKSRVSHGTQLIGLVLKRNNEFVLKTPVHWDFDISYHFRDALGLSFEVRSRGPLKSYLLIDDNDPLKKPNSFQMWTQSPIINFSKGDTFSSNNQNLLIQVQSSSTIGWDSSINDIYEGNVTFKVYDSTTTPPKLEEYRECNQYDFLQMLVTGKTEIGKRLITHY